MKTILFALAITLAACGEAKAPVTPTVTQPETQQTAPAAIETPVPVEAIKCLQTPCAELDCNVMCGTSVTNCFVFCTILKGECSK